MGFVRHIYGKVIGWWPVVRCSSCLWVSLLRSISIMAPNNNNNKLGSQSPQFIESPSATLHTPIIYLIRVSRWVLKLKFQALSRYYYEIQRPGNHFNRQSRCFYYTLYFTSLPKPFYPDNVFFVGKICSSYCNTHTHTLSLHTCNLIH